jgi:anti-sigma factor RsiW
MTNDRQFACPDRLTEITAFLDGELQAADTEELERHLAACDGCEAELRRQQLSKNALRRLSISLNASPEMRSRVEAALAEPAQRRSDRGLTLVLGLAAALLIFVFAGAGWYRLTQSQPSPAQMNRAAQSHTQITSGANPVGFASSDPASVAAWAASSTGNRIDVPPGNVAGFRLIGARSGSDVAAGSVTLVYESAGKRISCTIVPLTRVGPMAPQPTLPTSVTAIDGSNVAAWRDDKSIYLLAGDLDADSMLGLARQIAQSG